MKVCTAVQKTRVKSSRKSVNKRYFLKLINLYLGRIFLDDPFLAITLIRHENSPDNKQMNTKITPKTAQFSVWPKSLATMRSNPSCHATTQVAKTRLNDLLKGKHESVILVKLFKKSQKNNIFFMKNSKNNNIIWGFSFQFYVYGFSLYNEQKMNLAVQEILFRTFEICSFKVG